MIIYSKQGRYYIQDGSESFSLSANEIDFADAGLSGVKFIFDRWPPDNSRSKLEKYYAYNQVLNRDGDAYGTTFQDVDDGVHSGVDVNVQDQTTDVIIQKFNQIEQSTTLSSDAVIDDRTLTLTAITGAIDGKYIVLFNPVSKRFSTFTQIGAPSGNVITLDAPIDFAYPSGTFVDIGFTDMAVNGAVTPQTFGLRGTGVPDGVELTFDMTRIVITVLTTNAPAYNLFGDLTKLVNGIIFRTRNHKTFNIFNVKSNGEWAGMMYDLSAADAVNPNQGQNGWVGRMTFAGPSKMGVVIRLPIGTDAEFIVQDDLTNLELFEIVAEGHITVK